MSKQPFLGVLALFEKSTFWPFFFIFWSEIEILPKKLFDKMGSTKTFLCSILILRHEFDNWRPSVKRSFFLVKLHYLNIKNCPGKIWQITNLYRTWLLVMSLSLVIFFQKRPRFARKFGNFVKKTLPLQRRDGAATQSLSSTRVTNWRAVTITQIRPCRCSMRQAMSDIITAKRYIVLLSATPMFDELN